VEYRAVEQNLRESFRAVARCRPSGEVCEFPGVSIASAGVAFQMFNAAFLSSAVPDETELTRRILQARQHFRARGQEWSYWACEGFMDRAARKRQKQVFLYHGMRHSVDLPGMVAEQILPPARRLPQLEIRRVHNGSVREDFCAIGSLCIHVPLPWFCEVFDNDSVWSPFEAWVGYRDGEPVSTTAVVVSPDALGVYNVATVPEHQHHGYAEVVMRAALDSARRQHGISRSVLQSTPAGFALYQRMGYRTVTRVSVYAS
jgi:ribosomal protein S18 acetylase RimI-like enzyme